MSSIDKKPKFEPDPPPDVTGLSQEEALVRYVQWQQMQLDRIADWWPKENSSRLARLEQFAPLVGTWPIVDYSYVSLTLSDMVVCDPLIFSVTDTYDYSGDNSVGWKAISLSDDGTKLYASNPGAGGLGRGIAQYDMSAFDMTTLSFTAFKAETSFHYGLKIKDDGTRIFVLDGNTDDLKEFSLSTPFEISSMNTTPVQTKNLGLTSPTHIGLAISSDGVNMYLGLNQANSYVIYQWTMSTAWDISTAALAATLDVRTVPNWPTGVNWYCFALDISADGLVLITNGQSGTFYRFDLTTAYDLTTAEFSTVIAATGTGVTEGVAISSDCQMVYVNAATSDTFYEFEIG